MLDGGVPDAGTTDDGGVSDMGVAVDAATDGDAGAIPPVRRDDGGCGCRVVASGDAGGSGAGAFAALMVIAGLLGARRRRR